MVGVAGGVMMVIPGYSPTKPCTTWCSANAHIAAIVACLLFVTVDLGRPDLLALIPGLGEFNFPISMLRDHRAQRLPAAQPSSAGTCSISVIWAKPEPRWNHAVRDALDLGDPSTP